MPFRLTKSKPRISSYARPAVEKATNARFGANSLVGAKEQMMERHGYFAKARKGKKGKKVFAKPKKRKPQGSYVSWAFGY